MYIHIVAILADSMGFGDSRQNVMAQECITNLGSSFETFILKHLDIKDFMRHAYMWILLLTEIRKHFPEHVRVAKLPVV